MTSVSPLLAIHTLADSCSVALLDSSGVLVQRQGTGRRRHAREVLGLVDDLLRDSGVTLQALRAIAVVSGPGSFTGLRIGTTVAQGLAFSTSLPVIPVSSLAVLAMAGAGHASCMQCLLAARPGEYYTGTYRVDHGQPSLLDEERVTALPLVSGVEPACIVTDATTAEALGTDPRAEAVEPVIVHSDAGVLARIAAGLAEQDPSALVPPSRAVPVYLKNDLEYRKSGTASL